MKKIFILAMAAAAMVSCGTATKYTITGTSEEFEDGKLKLKLPYFGHLM